MVFAQSGLPTIQRPGYLYRLRMLVGDWIAAFAVLFIAICLIQWCYRGAFHKQRPEEKPRRSTSYQTPRSQGFFRGFAFGDIFARLRQRRDPPAEVLDTPPPPQKRATPGAMRGPRRSRAAQKKISRVRADLVLTVPKSKQPYEAFLVLDVEATCHLGTDFNYPNEIIELPVCLMRWKDRADDSRASDLEVIDEFRSFVRPSWRPTLSPFCMELTGIKQEQVDAAPPFSVVLDNLKQFMIGNGLLDDETGERLVRFCWCSDGPFDIRDFVVKQCFISQVPMPEWIQRDILDVRMSVLNWLSLQTGEFTIPAIRTLNGAMRRSLNIPAQLKALELPNFEGRQHSGIDDTRNIAKIVTELARRGVSLVPNTAINPSRRWQWMGKNGRILEEEIT